jgi:hypothetical protein
MDCRDINGRLCGICPACAERAWLKSVLGGRPCAWLSTSSPSGPSLAVEDMRKERDRLKHAFAGRIEEITAERERDDLKKKVEEFKKNAAGIADERDEFKKDLVVQADRAAKELAKVRAERDVAKANESHIVDRLWGAFKEEIDDVRRDRRRSHEGLLLGALLAFIAFMAQWVVCEWRNPSFGPRQPGPVVTKPEATSLPSAKRWF